MPTRDIPLSRNSQMVSILCIHGQRAGTFSPNCSLVKLPISHSPCAKFLLQIGDTPPAGQFEVLTPYCIATPTSPSFQWTFTGYFVISAWSSLSQIHTLLSFFSNICLSIMENFLSHSCSSPILCLEPK